MQLGARAQLQRPEVQTTCWSTHRRKRTWMRSWLWAAQDVGDWTTQYRRWKVHGVGLIPAETSAFGTVGPHPVLLLPGRFDAALAGWHMLGRAMLMRLTGNAEPPCLRAAKLTRKVSSTAGLAELVAVRCEGSLATPLASGYVPISALGRANGWILIPSESEGRPEHSEVAVRPWP